MDNATVLLIMAGASGLGVIVSMVAALLMLRWRRRLIDQHAEVTELKEELRALCAGAVGADERVGRVEQRTRRLKERQERLESRDNGERLYAQAIRMARNGAGVDELISVCGLSSSEADLIVMMHRLDEAS